MSPSTRRKLKVTMKVVNLGFVVVILSLLVNVASEEVWPWVSRYVWILIPAVFFVYVVVLMAIERGWRGGDTLHVGGTTADRVQAFRAELIDLTAELWVSGERAPLKAVRTIGMEYLAPTLVAKPDLIDPELRDEYDLGADDEIPLGDQGFRFVDVFQELLHGSVLLLGPAGAGKSVELWTWAQQLIEVARENEAAPVPVVLELHRWQAHGDVRFEEFVVAELGTAGRSLPSHIVREQCLAGSLVLLLDGLDELSPGQLPVVVQGLNSFLRGQRQRHVMQQIVVASRFDLRQETTNNGPTAGVTTSNQGANDASTPRTSSLALRSAVVIQPLEPALIRQTLATIGRPVAALGERADRDPDLLTFLSTPLWWSIAVAVSRDMSTDELRALAHGKIGAELKEALYQRFIDDRLRSVGDSQYTEALRRGLSYVAVRTMANGQQVLYLEDMRGDWLGDLELIGKARRRLGLSVGAANGAVAGLVAAMAGMYFGSLWWDGLTWFIVIGTATGLSTAVTAVAESPAQLVGHVRWSLPAAWHAVRTGWRASLPFAAFFGLITGVVITFTAGPSAGFGSGVIALLAAFAFKMSAHITGESVERLKPIRGRSATPSALRLSFAFGATEGLVVGLTIGIVGGVLFGILIGLALDGPSGVVAGVAVGVTFASPIATLIGMRRGAGPLIEHWATVSIISRSELMPVPVREFLEKGIGAGLLYPEGPGWRFMHRTLQEHLARSSSDYS